MAGETARDIDPSISEAALRRLSSINEQADRNQAERDFLIADRMGMLALIEGTMARCTGKVLQIKFTDSPIMYDPLIDKDGVRYDDLPPDIYRVEAVDLNYKQPDKPLALLTPRLNHTGISYIIDATKVRIASEEEMPETHLGLHPTAAEVIAWNNPMSPVDDLPEES